MIKIPSDYNVIENGTINTDLRQDQEYAMLFFKCECELLLKQEFLMGTESTYLQDT